jgi:hypothetical protein
MTVSDSDIDDAILAVVKPSWRKVAFIVGRAAKHVGGEFAEKEDAYQIVARRIQALAADGRLASQGNLTKWRFSEVKIP